MDESEDENNIEYITFINDSNNPTSDESTKFCFWFSKFIPEDKQTIPQDFMYYENLTPRDSLQNSGTAQNSTPLSLLNGTLRKQISNTGITRVDDGPRFREQIHFLERSTLDLKHNLKKLIKKLENFVDAEHLSKQFYREIMQIFNNFELADENIITHFNNFETEYIKANDNFLSQVESLLLEPLKSFLEKKVKVMELEKKEFDQESNEYYGFQQKYLSIKTDWNPKKKNESDSKHNQKKKNFDLKRFNYFNNLQNLIDPQKTSPISFYLTNFGQKQMLYHHLLGQKAFDTLKGFDRSMKKVNQIIVKNLEMSKEIDEKKNLIGLTGMTNAFLDTSSNSGIENSEFIGSQPELENETISDTPTHVNIENIIAKDVKKSRHFSFDSAAILQKSTEKSGFLFVLNSMSPTSKTPTLSSWKQAWCVVGDGKFQEFLNWKKLDSNSQSTYSLPLLLLTVRIARDCERRFCFEIVSPQIGKRIYQAADSEEVKQWIQVIQAAIENGLATGESLNITKNYTQSKTEKSQNRTNSIFETVKKINLINSLSDKNLNEKESNSCLQQQPPIQPKQETNLKIEPWNKQKYKNVAEDLLDTLRTIDKGNKFCADCNAPNPEWASINLGCILCIECSGIHRSLGTHITKVRSLTLDTTSWTQHLIEVMKALGNTNFNSIFEGKILWNSKPVGKRRVDKEHFIKEKYVHKNFADKINFDKEFKLDEFIKKLLSEKNLALALQLIASEVDLNFNTELTKPLLFKILEFPSRTIQCKSSKFSLILTEFLIQNGAKLNLVDQTKQHSVESHDFPIFKDLCTTENDVSLKLSLLHHAAYNKDLELIQLLLGKGANPTICTKEGHTPLDILNLYASPNSNTKNSVDLKKLNILTTSMQKQHEVVSAANSMDNLSVDDFTVICEMKLREAAQKWMRFNHVK
ncbi:hypothetical protein HDU92_006693 [Lobulomyces angularis]|nr:hypothetical protein HDU92_006693 [Lobulomyces angularis]